MPTRWAVGELAAHPPQPPSLDPHLVEAEQPRGPPRRPTPLDRVLDPIQQAGLDARVHPRRDRAGRQSQRAFPSCRCSATACSATVARSRSTSSRAAANAATSADWPGRPGTAAATASTAPRLATRQVCTTVERSTPYRSAASRWVTCPVTIEIHISYFSLGDNRRRDFLLDTVESDIINSLPVRQARRPVAEYF